MSRVEYRTMNYVPARRLAVGRLIGVAVGVLGLAAVSAFLMWHVAAPSAPTAGANTSAGPSGLQAARATIAQVNAPVAITGGSAVLPKLTDNRVFYVGGEGSQSLLGSYLLSNGDILLTGRCDDLNWVPADVERVTLDAGQLDSKDPGIGFILHVSSDLQTLRRVIHFPAGTVGNIQRIRGTEAPGSDTGTLYISGARTVDDPQRDGYFIARLVGNGVSAPISGVQWVHSVSAKPRRASGFQGQSQYKILQPWDVGNDGRVVFGVGADYDFDWAAMEVIDSNGQPLTMPGWPNEGGKSMIVLKAGRQNSMRSHTQEDFDFRTDDENGNPGRKGRYPDDVYFNAPHPNTRGPGYTGYGVGRHPTQRLGQIAIDRRNNHLYFGYNGQSRLPGGNPDFEPAIVAMDDQGNLKWWARGYQEIERTGENEAKHRDAINSPPDQYIDGVAIDYANNRLVVNARCHGNGVINFWQGDKLVHSPGSSGFQNRFTGRNGNIHIGWLGKYGLDDGRIYAATYVAEFAAGSDAPKLTGGKLAGWPNPNAGWPDVNTTRVGSEISVDRKGRVYIVGNGRRPFTTNDAYVTNYKPDEGTSQWSDFVRVYEPDLSTLAYSSLLRGKWEPGEEKSTGHDVNLRHVVPANGGLIVVGEFKKSDTSDAPDTKTTNAPKWGKPDYTGPGNGIVGALKFE